MTHCGDDFGECKKCGYPSSSICRARFDDIASHGADGERVAIVAWLRQQAVLRRGLRELTDAIERGEHTK